jgi:hypothetical protein
MELKSLSGLQKYMESGMCFRPLFNLAEYPHLNGRTPVLADNLVFNIHKKHLKGEEIMVVMQPPVKWERVGGSCDGVPRLALLFFLLNKTKVFASADEVLVSPNLERIPGLILIIRDGSLFKATEKRLGEGGIGSCGCLSDLAHLAL